MTRSGASPASPRHHAIAAHLHQEKAAPLHRRTVELELVCGQRELAAAQASIRRNVIKQEVHKPGGGRLAKPFAPTSIIGARSPVRGLRLPKAAAEVPVSPRPTTVLVK